MSRKRIECELAGTWESKTPNTKEQFMGKTMGLATLIVVGGTVVFGMPGALVMCALSPLIGAGLWGFAKGVKWM